MVNWHIVNRPFFEVIGKKTWIAGTEDNEAFGQFWDQCRLDGFFTDLERLSGLKPGRQTNGVTLGVSCVVDNPANREFYYMIAIEKPSECDAGELDTYPVPASTWAVFECRSPVPEAIVEAEMYAFMEWLPTSGYAHDHAPEMEVYPPGSGESRAQDHYCEFWLPVVKTTIGERG